MHRCHRRHHHYYLHFARSTIQICRARNKQSQRMGSHLLLYCLNDIRIRITMPIQTKAMLERVNQPKQRDTSACEAFRQGWMDVLSNLNTSSLYIVAK